MRLVRFEDESGGFAVDLHPLITVISGLPVHVRERLIYGVAALPKGGDPGGQGTLEVHGVFLDLNRENLELLELNQDLDVVLKPTDLPGVEEVAPLEPSDSGFDEPVGLGSVDLMVDSELVGVRQEAAEAFETYEMAKRSLAMIETQLVEIEAERQNLLADLNSLDQGDEGIDNAELERSRQELAALMVPETGDAHPDLTDSDPRSTGAADVEEAEQDAAQNKAAIEARLTYLIEEADRLKKQAKALRAIDPVPVRQAYAALEMSTGTGWTESPEAESLAHEWEDHEVRRNDLNELMAGERSGTADSSSADAGSDTTQAESPQAETADAENAWVADTRELRPPELDPTVVSRLESVHDEIFELEGKSSLFSASKNRRRVEALRTEEVSLLLELGFDSWPSYIMGVPISGPSAAAAHRIEIPEEPLAGGGAESPTSNPALSTIDSLAPAPDEEVIDPEITHAGEISSLEEERANLLAQTLELLGVDEVSDPVAELRSFQVAADSGSVGMRPDDAAAALRFALEETGAEMPARSMSAVELKSLATGWLETMSGLEDRLGEVAEDRDLIEVEIAQLLSELEIIEAEVPPDRIERSSSDSPQIQELQERVHELEVQQVDQTDSDERRGSVEARLQRLDEREGDLRASVVEREPRVVQLREDHDVAKKRLRRVESAVASAVDSHPLQPRQTSMRDQSSYVGGSAGAEAVEWYVLARLAQQRAVSFVGSVPILIDDAFRNWPIEALEDVFTRLERMGEVIQMVYLTDDPKVGDWARKLGSDRALVLDMRLDS